ncbi:UNVERIFIED_CONTAM: hypothetical protein GTU68_043767 [Idotea baltica]|nr:hypothetical protein [Idotea baltica]
MVDVGDKAVTTRTAQAQSIVRLNPAVIESLKENDGLSKKGPVFQTAILAGIMAAKKTHDLIPLCHPLPLNKCSIDISINDKNEVLIESLVKTKGKTGVEMEALTGASIAALTIYDMCKSMGHDIVIANIQLIVKIGGKKKLIVKPIVNGLILAGGRSTRMGEDKAAINYHGVNQVDFLQDKFKSLGIDSYVSCREEQSDQYTDNAIKDVFLDMGPFGAILSAFKKSPNSAWMVLACDLPLLTEKHIQLLLDNRDQSKIATCFHNPETGWPDPLFTLWEPKAYARLLAFMSLGYNCPRKVLINSDVNIIHADNTDFLMNANSPSDKEEIKKRLRNS